MDFLNVGVLCVGDVMLDRFSYSDMERISPEAPVPILRIRETREMLGGAGNVAANVEALGGTAILVGLVGCDPVGDCDQSGRRVRSLLAGFDRIVDAVVTTPERPTTCKTRFVAGIQHVVRTDEESLAPATPEERRGIMMTVDRWLPRVGALILSDYGKGALPPALVADVVAAARRAAVPVFVDPKSRDFADYRGATCLTPNLKELAAATGEVGPDADSVAAAARIALARSGADAILVTRSQKGMMLVEASGAVHSVPSLAREVFDVSGAGDTVIATMALCRASGMSLVQAMHVANAAAGVVVGKSGTATAGVSEVLREIAAQEEANAGPAPDGLRLLPDVVRLVAGWKRQGLSVGFANGCFDVLHPGHVSLLARARRECDRLVVAINDDAGVRALKGPSRPVNDVASRAMVLAALRHVDCVVSFGEPTPLELIRALVPDVLVKGSDYSVPTVVGADLVMAAGGRVVLADLVPGQSTTDTVARIAAGVGA